MVVYLFKGLKFVILLLIGSLFLLIFLFNLLSMLGNHVREIFRWLAKFDCRAGILFLLLVIVFFSEMRGIDGIYFGRILYGQLNNLTNRSNGLIQDVQLF